MSWQIGALVVSGRRSSPASRGTSARIRPRDACAGGHARRARRARPDRVRAAAERQADDGHLVLIAGFALGAAPGFVVGAVAALGVEPRLRAGPVDALADGGLGAVRRPRRGPRAPHRPQHGPRPARPGVRRGGPGVRRDHGRLGLGHVRRGSRRSASSSRSPRRRCRSTSRTPSGTSSSAWLFGPCSSARCSAIARGSRCAGPTRRRARGRRSRGRSPCCSRSSWPGPLVAQPPRPRGRPGRAGPCPAPPAGSPARRTPTAGGAPRPPRAPTRCRPRGA